MFRNAGYDTFFQELNLFTHRDLRLKLSNCRNIFLIVISIECCTILGKLNFTMHCKIATVDRLLANFC